MFGLKKEDGQYVFRAAVHTDQLFLNLYLGNRRIRQIPFDINERIGDVWILRTREDLSLYSYCYEADGVIFSDPNGTVFSGRKRFGNLRDGLKILKTPIGEAVEMPEASEEWCKDRPLDIPYHQSIIYRLHVRGFTQHPSSGVPGEERGTFAGVIEKIPYLVSLGVTTVELMPVYEFNEVMLPNFGPDGRPKEALRPTGNINYWGFTDDALQMAPKSSYTSDHKNPRAEFRRMILELHRHGLEAVIDLYFTGKNTPDHITTVMRYWRMHYHVDGVHVIGEAPLEVIARDPYLSRFKIWADSWDGYHEENSGRNPSFYVKPHKYLADYNIGFQNDMRRILKGDEAMIGTLMSRVRDNRYDRGEIHFMANLNGFSLMDMLSYDRKHNDDNHENNHDGTDENYSWNCGDEGHTRRKSVRLLRKKMWRNACLLLMLSQGTPLLYMGDEFGATRRGNNNAYCEDSALNWLNWRLIEKNEALYQFMKEAIAFRKAHPVFSQKDPLKSLDYRSLGIPDISFHGENAWRPDMENFRRQLGVMYAGGYADDETFLVLYNFHWETHEFRLPHPPVGYTWVARFDTADEEHDGILREEAENRIIDERTNVEPRSIKVVEAVRDKSYKPKKKRKGKLERQKDTPKKQMDSFKKAEPMKQVVFAEQKDGREAKNIKYEGLGIRAEDSYDRSVV